MTNTPNRYWNPPAQDGMVRVGPLLPIRDLLRDFGVPPERVWQKFGFTASTFSDPENMIAAKVRGAILADCVRETGCPHFGLLLGQRLDASSLGAIGFMARNAPDVRTALSELAANLRLHNRAAAPYLETAGRQAIFVYETLHPYAEGWEQIDDAAMGLVLNLMRALCGPDWLPNEVCFRRGKPDDIQPYRRFFRAPLLFGAERTTMIFSASWLSAKVQNADPGLRTYFEQYVQIMKGFSSEDLVAQVNQQLIHLLGRQCCSLRELASQLGLHPRTLNRRLQEAGTSFRELHRTARHQLACQLLRDTGSSIPAIATLLGFSGSNAFVRAFAQWESVPPATWRKGVRSVTPLGRK
jgi:AraC-like DNA-binding protein